MKNNTLRIGAAALVTAFLASTAHAEFRTTNLGVSATVEDNCTVSATSVAFGQLSASGSGDETTAGNIEVICTAEKPNVTVTLDGGQSADGSLRQMASSGGETVPYMLHSDAAHNETVSIDGSIYTGPIRTAQPQNIAVYGQVPEGNYTAGSYADTVLVTLTY